MGEIDGNIAALFVGRERVLGCNDEAAATRVNYCTFTAGYCR
jgi:hypothetical protein